jgi:hypothetical protein
VDGFLELVSDLRPTCRRAGVALGYALHSLRATTPDEARAIVGALPLEQVKNMLDELIAAHAPRRERPWWEAMNDEGSES